MSQTYFATIRDRKGCGDNYLYVRLRNVNLQYWNFTNNLWQDLNSNETTIKLVEHQDSDMLQSRYAAVITIPGTTGIIAEYVEVDTGNVIGEEGLQLSVSDINAALEPIQTSVDRVPTNPLLTDDIRLDNLDSKISLNAKSTDISGLSSKIDTVTESTNETLDRIEREATTSRKLQSNKAVISSDNSTVTIYDDDGITVLYCFDISSDQRSRSPRSQ